jgi:DegV family protein with EDD domain
MNQVRIVTDSIADIPASLASELGIAVVPCQVFFGQEAYLDGIDLLPHQFYRKLADSAELPLTSQPSVSLFVETYQRLLDEQQNKAIISIHVAGNLSGTVNAAWAATQTMPDPSRIEVVDSGQVSMGQGWVAIEAARLAQTGADQTQVSQTVQRLLARVRTAAVIDTLENLYKGGRISQFTAVLGTALRIKPLVTVCKGRIDLLDKIRTRARAARRLEEVVRNWGPLAQICVLHTGAEQSAHDLAAQLQDLVSLEKIIISPAGSALTTHLGLNAVGVCALTTGDE